VLQNASAKVVSKALAAVADKDIPTVIDSLSQDEQALLMKYLYR
jgi:hypothetical protein